MSHIPRPSRLTPLFASLLLYGAVLSGCSDAASQGPERIDPDAIPDVHWQPVYRDLKRPLFLTHAGDGSGRVFILEQHGTIRVYGSDDTAGKIWLDLRDRVIDGGERGLLGLAFHPEFKDNGRFFVNYTTQQAGELTTRIAEFTTDESGTADPGSERVLLSFEQPWANHNGGMVAFGPDGYLYIGTGDGGAANDPNNNGQDLSTLLGAILRIDVDSTTGDLPYGIPEDNPFIEREGARAEVYAYGLRNAWRFCFDPKTGLLYVGDVGQNAREEVDIVRKGGNYGWRIMEGSIRTPGVPGAETADVEDMILPIAEYRHPIGQSITGGYVYRGSNMTALQGVYLYADYVSGRLWGLRYVDGEVTAQRELPRPEMAISSFGRDEDGELYFCAHIDGVVYRLTNAAE